ncbi:MAG: indolepyruvate ferredoxin oxidoreductase alpha subunit [Gammaproteobacteria bacterium]|jgi:indolepyruvate ferredoxin oxidoreductase alpha subunit
MAERSFAKEVALLRLGEGEEFQGEGILAVAKAMLQAGVSYVGGYQGAPVSHMMDVFADGREILDELGVHVESCANEATAAAMLGASINYPIRGCAVWKSTVGTNVASDALSNLASAGVTGGAVIVVGEDYGDGASIIQERSHAFAMKSQIWLLDPRPNLPSLVAMVENAFELSEASQTPVMLEMRIRACHVHGSFTAKDNKAAEYSHRNVIENPIFDYGKICLPPSTYVQEQHKVEVRWPAAVRFIRERGLNEVFPASMPGANDDVGIICQGGMYNAVIRALQLVDMADANGKTRVPLYCLNVTYPLIPEEVTEFCTGKTSVLVVEEAQPNYIEEAISSLLRKADLNTKLEGKGPLPMAGEYTGEVVLRGVSQFLSDALGARFGNRLGVIQAIDDAKHRAGELLGGPVPARPPGFCTGCPERPVFSALKLAQRTIGNVHVSADIGCHTFATLPPFHVGNTVLGYGLGLASSTGVAPSMKRRTVSIMGDGGFWHNGLTSGVANSVFNKSDGVLVIMNNGYTSATGAQNIPSSAKNPFGEPGGQSIEAALRGVGVRSIRKVRTYSVAKMVKTLKKALSDPAPGLRVIIANGECQLARQRRIKPINQKRIAEGKRVVRTRFGIDDDLCTGDHSCIRLSGCPSLTIKPNPNPLRPDPVASVNNDCVGCGLCGEVAHAAVLCPSFYRAEIVNNPTFLDRWLRRARDAVIGFLAGHADDPTYPAEADSVPGGIQAAANSPFNVTIGTSRSGV